MHTKITICVQARSNSKRFPNKIHELVNKHHTVLDLVLSKCLEAKNYINKFNNRGLIVDVALCIPINDPSLKDRDYQEVKVIKGSEDDVLSRYFKVSQELSPDYICRVTADCPLIPSFIISKCIYTAVLNNYDYFSNVDERVRTAPDGLDCEVFSDRMLRYTEENCKSMIEREHVTLFMRNSPPKWAKIGVIINHLDLSKIKLSIDSPEDLEHVRQEYKNVDDALKRAEVIFGATNVHRF